MDAHSPAPDDPMTPEQLTAAYRQWTDTELRQALAIFDGHAAYNTKRAAAIRHVLTERDGTSSG